MIAKIMTGSNVAGMVKYNSNKVQGKGKDDKAQFLGAYNISDSSTNGIINSITERNNRNNARVSKPNIHISLNFPKDEVLDNDKILEVAHRYMQLMNFSEQPYAIYRHYDRVHPHIHIVSTQIDIEGKKINDSNIIYRSISRTRQIEKEFNLIPLYSDKTIKTELTEARGVVDYINITIRNVLDKKPTNFYQFDRMLNDLGISRIALKEGHYFEFDNTKIEGFNKIESKISVKDLEYPYYIDFFLNEFKKNTAEKAYTTKQVQAKIYAITGLLKSPITIDELKTLFLKKGLELKFERIGYGEKEGKINKLFVQDKKSGIKYSATELNIRTATFLKSYIIDSTGPKTNDNEDKLPTSDIAGRSSYYEPPKNIQDVVFSNLINYLTTYSPAETQQQDLRKKQRRKKRK